ncbi:MAG: CpsB/CapC family capsule biosynthesis tyrosine phosphatase [bacterium]
MIDIHAHILPGLDDGVRSIDEAVEIIKQAERGGIKIIVATPHLIWGTAYAPSRETIEKGMKELQSRLSPACRHVTFLSGAELYLDGTQDINRILKEDPITLNNQNYLLIEFPLHQVPPNTREIVTAFLNEGIIPIIAHPERNKDILDKPNLLFELIEQGAVSQLDGGSLLGHHGRRAKKWAEIFLVHHLVQVIASDVHFFLPGDVPYLYLAYERAVDLIGERAAKIKVITNPKRIIEGKEIRHLPPPIPYEEEDISGI